MQTKRFVYIFIGVVILTLGIAFWRVTQNSPSPVQKVFRTTHPSDLTNEPPTQAPHSSEEPALTEDATSLHAESIAFTKSLLSEAQLANPEVQQFFELLASEEFQAFTATPRTLEERFEFLADRGADVPRNLNMLLFRESFPTGEPADFEPMMRQKLLHTLQEAGIGGPEEVPAEILAMRANPDLMTELTQVAALLEEYGQEEGLRQLYESDPALARGVEWSLQQERAHKKKRAVIRAFWDEKRHFHWQMGYFKGQFAGEAGSSAWVDEVLASLSPAAPAVPMFVEPSEVLSPSKNAGQVETVVPDISTTPQEKQPLPHSDSPIVREGETQPTSPAAPEQGKPLTPVTPRTSQSSQLPTDADFETVLRERFSPARLNRAMAALNRYGPEEGVRRLKASDPELAVQVERLLQKQQEKD